MNIKNTNKIRRIFKAVVLLSIAFTVMSTGLPMAAQKTVDQQIIIKENLKEDENGGRSDSDNNGFIDAYEQELAEMFCPSLILHSGDQGVSPEPVEYMFTNTWDNPCYWISSYEFLQPTVYGGELDPPVYIEGDDYSFIDSWWERDHGPRHLCDPTCNSLGFYQWLRHFDYAGPNSNCQKISEGYYDQPAGWYDAYENGNSWARPGSYYDNTVYAHLFTHNNEYIIQYWFFYPFNDFVNNHEGDWEHINVVITSQDPATAQIDRAIYYFHHYYYIAYTTQVENPEIFDCYVIDGTHPVVFTGGYAYCEVEILGWGITSGEGNGSHGSYPICGTWPEVSPEEGWGLLPAIDETVDGQGYWIPHSAIIDNEITDRDGVFIIKGTEDYNYQQNPEMSWLKANIIWGYPYVKSMGTEVTIPVGYDITNCGNRAPCGPAYNDGWEVVDWDVGDANGKSGWARYDSLPNGYSHVSDAEWVLQPSVITNLDNGERFSDIQSAIDDDDTLAGQRIFVPHGIYNEHIRIDKSITLIGQKKQTTIIDGGGNGDVLMVSAADVTVTGFTIRNSGNDWYRGIGLNSDRALITDNIITDNAVGIVIVGWYNTLTENTITNNDEYGIYILPPEPPFMGANYNQIYHNNFIDNTVNALDDSYPGYGYHNTNYWDNGYPSGGNYWDDFDEYGHSPYGIHDDFWGLNQNQPGVDGIMDKPGGGLNCYYVGYNKDNYSYAHQNGWDAVALTNERLGGLNTCPKPTCRYCTIYQYLLVTMKEPNGHPLIGIPTDQFAFTVTPTSDTEWYGTFSPTITFDHTNGGLYYFNITGGTSIVGNLTIQTTVQGQELNSVLLPCKTVDYNRDGTVALADFTIFSQDFGKTRWRSDFSWDGSVTLADFTMFAGHYGHHH
jgi:parallel beta-helix repeat protein